MEKQGAVNTTASEAHMVEAEALLEKVEVEARYRKNFSDFWKLAIMVISSIFIGYHMITSGKAFPKRSNTEPSMLASYSRR